MVDEALPAHVRALLAPGALTPGVTATLVQTHISYVLLAGGQVYKLKKPRDLGFLDYSTPARRRAACEAEVALNRRLTSGVYLDVAPVTRAAGRYRLGGDGRVVDYAVVMRRLPADGMMDALLARDAVTPAMLARLARHLAAFYAGAATGGRIDGFAAPEALLANWQENFLQTLPYAGRTLAAGAYLQMTRAVYGELLRLRPLWAERIAAGRARDCHGDLRLSAVCFEDETIQVYDCIEFNERFRYGDAAADIAFLAMDLDGHGRPDLADEFVARHVAASGDTTLPAVLPFYACYRAYVRGKVDSFQLDEPEVPPVQRRAARAAARRRFTLAASYARPRPITLAAVTGGDADTRNGVAAALAGRVGAVLIDGTDTGAVAAAEVRLRGRISVTLTFGGLDGGGYDMLRIAAGRARARLLTVAVGCDGAPPGAVTLPAGLPLRDTLRALHDRLGLAPAAPSGNIRKAR